MKKIINGKTYNTDTARLVGEASSAGRTKADFKYWEQGLYQTKKGQYFLAGEGGALTIFAVSAGDNSTCYGEKIELLTKEEAMIWTEENLTTDEYIKEFGEIEG